MITYRDAGVDVTAGYEAVRLMREHVQRTFDGHVLTDIGSFGGVYDLQNGDVLVAGTDGVGTKLKAAFVLDRHDTVGIDCVAMCVNDIVCLGARPLFFLDYIATGKLKPEVVSEIVKGVAEGCLQAGCALIGGETAEMPGFYGQGEYDMAGFAVGMAKKSSLIDGRAIRPGDKLVGLKSSGIHSNGFSLVRQVCPMKPEFLSHYAEDLGMTLGEALLTPTKIYVKTVLALLERFTVKGMAHITGGGFIENVPRMLREGLTAHISMDTYPLPPIFQMLITDAGLDLPSACNTFNMGIGLVMAVGQEEAEALAAYVNEETEDEAVILGCVTEGSERIVIR